MKSYDYKNREGVRKICWQDFYDLTIELAEQVESYEPDLIIGIARGGLYPAAQLSHLLQIEFYPIKISRRENDVVVHEHPVWQLKPSKDVENKKVLLVDEIADTGETLQIVKAELKNMQVNQVKTATLFAHKHTDPKPDFVALTTDELVVNPWDFQLLKQGKLIKNPEYGL